MSWSVLIVLGATYAVIMLAMFACQSRLVHLPGIPSRALVATPARIGLEYEPVRIVTDDGIALHGWFVTARRPRAVLLFFHGNAGNISHRLDSLEIFHRLGLATLIIDYRGYGESEGTPSEQGLYRDAQAALRYLRDVRGVPQDKLVYFGRSLGGAVASRLATEYPPAALILESTFTSVPDMAAELYPFLPARWLARIYYDTRQNLKKIHCPLLIIHSPDDEIIPFRHGRALFEAANEPKQFLEIHGDHNTGFLSDRANYEQGIAKFLSWHLPN